MPTTKRADELKAGDVILFSVASVERTSTGYVVFHQSTGPYSNGRLQVEPPDRLFTVGSIADH